MHMWMRADTAAPFNADLVEAWDTDDRAPSPVPVQAQEAPPTTQSEASASLPTTFLLAGEEAGLRRPSMEAPFDAGFDDDDSDDDVGGGGGTMPSMRGVPMHMLGDAPQQPPPGLGLPRLRHPGGQRAGTGGSGSPGGASQLAMSPFMERDGQGGALAVTGGGGGGGSSLAQRIGGVGAGSSTGSSRHQTPAVPSRHQTPAVPLKGLAQPLAATSAPVTVPPLPVASMLASPSHAARQEPGLPGAMEVDASRWLVGGFHPQVNPPLQQLQQLQQQQPQQQLHRAGSGGRAASPLSVSSSDGPELEGMMTVRTLHGGHSSAGSSHQSRAGGGGPPGGGHVVQQALQVARRHERGGGTHVARINFRNVFGPAVHTGGGSLAPSKVKEGLMRRRQAALLMVQGPLPFRRRPQPPRPETPEGIKLDGGCGKPGSPFC